VTSKPAPSYSVYVQRVGKQNSRGKKSAQEMRLRGPYRHSAKKKRTQPRGIPESDRSSTTGVCTHQSANLARKRRGDVHQREEIHAKKTQSKTHAHKQKNFCAASWTAERSNNRDGETKAHSSEGRRGGPGGCIRYLKNEQEDGLRITVFCCMHRKKKDGREGPPTDHGMRFWGSMPKSGG